MGEPLFRGMDRGEIDRQFNLRARWPEHPKYFARWAEESAAVRTRHVGRFDLAYGESAKETLDLFLPETAPPPPLLAFLHGGYWQALDKADFSYLAPAFLDSGIAYASLNYDLAPQVGLSVIVEQIGRALAWLQSRGRELGFDPERIFLAGHSAGGHLAALALLAADEGAAPRGACAVSGVYDLAPVSLSYHQDVLALTEEEVETLSPFRRIRPGNAPLICALGSEETDEFLRQQAEFVAACEAAGRPVTTVALPGRQHFSACDALGEPDHPLHRATCAMILGAG
ncbi:MAG TPA: alpha/beta hydrolase [Kiloniellales bacterium]|nr:alpha/beta hydrolase [Kiloniellales bacterium]